MEPSCVRQDLIPGTSRLFCDYLYHFDRVEGFYPGGAPDAQHISETAGGICFPDERRAGLVAALRDQNGDSAALDKLSKPGTVAVVTGQQVGLFSGPAYTVFKALTAVKLAEYLESRGIAAVPVFWLATEDHDLEEVDHAWVFNERSAPSEISAASLLPTGGPVGIARLGDMPFHELRAGLGDLPFADDVVERLRAAYHDGQTLGTAFGQFLKELLKDFGLLFLDPLAPAIRNLAAPFLTKAAEQAPLLVNALRDRSSQLEAAGYHAQVLVEKDASLLFFLNEPKRLPLRLKDGKFVSRDSQFTAEELGAMPERISPNALLRPVMQDYLLPTAAYVAGPAEIAYFAQSSVLYQHLLGRMPVIYPRNSFTLLDQRAAKLMARNALHLPDLLDRQENVKGKIAARLVPHDLDNQFAQLEQSLQSGLNQLQSDLREFDPTLQAAAHKSSAKVLYQVQKLRRKTARETLRRDEKAAADADYLMNLVFPQRHLQERLFSIVPFLAKFGLDFPHRLYEETQLNCVDHMLRVF